MTLTKRALIVSFFRSYPVLMAGTFLSGTLNALMSLAIPVSFGKYYQLAFHTHSPRGKLLDGMISIRHLHQFFWFFGILVLLKGMFTFLEKYLMGYSSERFSKELRERLFSTQLAFELSAYDKKPAGKFLLRYSGDLSAIQRYVMKGVMQFSIDIIFLTLSFALLMVLNLQMTLLALSSCIFGLAALYILNRFLQRLTVKRRNIRSEMLSFVSSRLHGILTVKAFNREPVEVRKYETSSDKLFNLGKKYFRWFGFLSALIPLVLYGALALVFYFSHQQRIHDKEHFPAHDLLIYIMVLLSVLPYLRRLLSVTLIWQAGNVSISKVLRILNAVVEKKTVMDRERLETGRLSIQDLSFGHATGGILFENFSARFGENAITRLTGTQGAGKTTLFKLMIGLYPARSGRITADGIELNSDTLHYFRRNIAVVSDEFPLLGKTVFEAVSYSRKEEKREKATDVLQSIGFDPGLTGDTVLDHPLTVAGSNLSHGQRKQLLLARALLTRKRILLLDEPFTGMDAIAVAAAVQVLNKLKRKRTIVVICSEWPSGLELDQTVSLKPRLEGNS